MPDHHRPDPPFGTEDWGTDWAQIRAFEAALRDDDAAGDAGALAPTSQLIRDLAEIERATAALRSTAPDLEPVTTPWRLDPPVVALRNSRSGRILRALARIATALVIAAGIVAAIAGRAQ